jgi:hypothetical protein
MCSSLSLALALVLGSCALVTSYAVDGQDYTSPYVFVAEGFYYKADSSEVPKQGDRFFHMYIQSASSEVDLCMSIGYVLGATPAAESTSLRL